MIVPAAIRLRTAFIRSRGIRLLLGRCCRVLLLRSAAVVAAPARLVVPHRLVMVRPLLPRFIPNEVRRAEEAFDAVATLVGSEQLALSHAGSRSQDISLVLRPRGGVVPVRAHGPSRDRSPAVEVGR